MAYSKLKEWADTRAMLKADNIHMPALALLSDEWTSADALVKDVRCFYDKGTPFADTLTVMEGLVYCGWAEKRMERRNRKTGEIINYKESLNPAIRVDITYFFRRIQEAARDPH